MRIFLFLVSSILFLQLNAQTLGFTVGYAGGFGNAKNINRVLYIYNTTANFDKDMNYLRNFHGLTFSFFQEFGVNNGYEIKWQNRHKIMKSRWTQQGVDYMREFKFRQNAFSFGLFFGGDKVYFGGSVDLMNWKGFTRAGPKDELKDIDFKDNKLFVNYTGSYAFLFKLQVGMSAFVGFTAGPLGFRVTYNYQFMTKHLDDLDNKLIGGNIDNISTLEDKFNNIGFEIYFKIGGDSW